MSEPVFPWNEIERLKEESSSEKEFYYDMRYLLNDSIEMLSLGNEGSLYDLQISLNALLDIVFEEYSE